METKHCISNGVLRAEILSRGATLSGLWFADSPHSLVAGFEDPLHYQGFPIYAGAVIGPLANRLRSGTAALDGQLWQMPKNENDAHTLHSGPRGVHARNWTIIAQSPESVTFGVSLEHRACGLPGNRQISARYALVENRLELTLSAETDRLTLMNLTHHPYWAITPDSLLQIHADKYLTVTEENLPTGVCKNVAGTSFDLRQPCDIPHHLDHNYVLSDAPVEKPRSVAILKTRGHQLDLHTTAPGLQVYAGGGLPPISSDLTRGHSICAGHVIAMEPQFWPDAPNHPNFPSVTLAPGRIWRQFTQYCLNC